MKKERQNKDIFDKILDGIIDFSGKAFDFITDFFIENIFNFRRYCRKCKTAYVWHGKCKCRKIPKKEFKAEIVNE